MHNQVKDLDHAIAELTSARSEMAAIGNDDCRYAYQRQNALIEPMSRIGLVMRYLEQLLESNRWSRSYQAPNARGA